jgi:hypothetical protein
MSDLISRENALEAVRAAMWARDAAEFERRLRALPAVQPKVKPLVWIEDGDGFCAKGATRTYAVFRLALDNSTWGAVGVKHTSQDKASVMAACQSDYEARILSALDNNNNRKEVMPPVPVSDTPNASDIGPGNRLIAGAAGPTEGGE